MSQNDLPTVLPIITKVLGITSSENVPEASNGPKRLWIEAETSCNPLVLQITETAAHELAAEIRRYERVRDSQLGKARP